MKKLLLLIFLLPTLAYSQFTKTVLAYHPAPTNQVTNLNLHLSRTVNDAADIKRAKKAIVFGTILNVTGAALAIFAPKFSSDAQTIKIYRYAGLGVGVTGFAFNIPAIFVLSKNRNKYY